jgi:protein gp37
MAEHSSSDILTSDWNPIIGCQRYSPGCRNCWWFDEIMPWQQRLGKLPKDLKENQALVLEKRFDPKILRAKKGIIGIVQHGDLFWDKVEDDVIHRVFDLLDADARDRQKKNQAKLESERDGTKYVLWTKRAKRMADFTMARYPDGVPSYLACGVSVENQDLADERLPHLMRVNGWRFVMIEPMLGPIDLSAYIENAHWAVVGSETGERARVIDLEWVRSLRDQALQHQVPFFVKQVGTSHKKPERKLDGREWNDFPEGFNKSSGKKR